MYYKKYLSDVKNKKLKPLVLIYGEELYILEKIMDAIKSSYVDEQFESLNYIKVDGKTASLSSIIEQAEQMPFMSEKKLMIIQDLNLFSQSMEGEESFYKYLENTNQSTLMAFVLKDYSLDKRKKVFKAIKKYGQIIELPKLKSPELSKWIGAQLQKEKKEIASRDLNYMIEAIGYLDRNSEKNLFDVKHELDKLIDYLEDEIYVKKESIDAVFVKSLQNNIFALVDNVVENRKEKALGLLDDMLLANEPVNRILFMIIKQYRNLLFSKALVAKGYSQKEVSEKLKVHNFVASKLVAQQQKVKLADLKRSYTLCLEADRNLKMGKLEQKLALEVLIAKL